jgi:hypothetical protein
LEVKSPFEQLLFTTTRIETTRKDGSISVGTGSIVHYKVQNKGDIFSLVTNKHVIKDTTEGNLLFNLTDKKVPLLGERYGVHISDFQNAWFGHSQEDIDVAVMPFSPVVNQLLQNGNYIYFKTISTSLIPTEEQTGLIDAIEDIIFIGYPNNIYDRTNLLPIVRKGTTATPFLIDYEGKPAFLIDASIFPGSSGSPVFLCNTGSYSQKGGGMVIGNRIFFLGIVSSVFTIQESNKIEMVDVPTGIQPIVKTSQMVDLGLVYKSRVVVEVIEDFLEHAANCNAWASDPIPLSPFPREGGHF